MDAEYRGYPDNAKVWIYQSNTYLDEDDIGFLKVEIDDFINTWESHGNMLKADYDVFHNLFVVIFVDEEGDTMCGRAQDASVNLMKKMEEQLEVEFLNRMNLAYMVKDKVVPATMDAFTKLIAEGVITDDTLVFNNTITTKKEFDTIFKAPLKNSWQAQLKA